MCRKGQIGTEAALVTNLEIYGERKKITRILSPNHHTTALPQKIDFAGTSETTLNVDSSCGEHLPL